MAFSLTRLMEEYLYGHKNCMDIFAHVTSQEKELLPSEKLPSILMDVKGCLKQHLITDHFSLHSHQKRQSNREKPTNRKGFYIMLSNGVLHVLCCWLAG